MQNIAQPWLAYTLTKSSLLLSLVGTMQFLPVLLFSLFAGVIVDKYPKKNILLITQASSLVITLILGILTLTGAVRYWHILVLAAALGFVNTLDNPARQAFVIELTNKDDLMNAIALNSSAFNIARVIGPAVAGLVMGYAGIAFCFLANSVSFGAVVISLLFIKPNAVQGRRNTSGKVLADIGDGLKYIYKNSTLMNTLMVVAVIATFAMNFSVLVPVFTKLVLHREETGFGLLMSMMGIGSFIGAMLIATKSKSGPRRFVMNVLPMMIGILMVIGGFINTYLLMGLCLAATGLCFVAFSSTANSIMQLNTENHYRGRVMSVYSLIFGGSTPIGNLYAGAFANWLGPKAGFAACGAMVVALLIPVYFYKRISENKIWQSQPQKSGPD
jgi:MFS family permease